MSLGRALLDYAAHNIVEKLGVFVIALQGRGRRIVYINNPCSIPAGFTRRMPGTPSEAYLFLQEVRP